MSKMGMRSVKKNFETSLFIPGIKNRQNVFVNFEHVCPDPAFVDLSLFPGYIRSLNWRHS